jgi:DNA polymerase-3 subunit epsilon
MKLNRSIVFFDVETTGVDISSDRIIEIAMIKLNPDGSKEHYHKRINPQGKEIRPEAFEKHKISLEDLKDCPTFPNIAEEVLDFIKDCDIGGYNCMKFDIPILAEELLRCNIPFNTKDFKVVDVYKLLTKAEPRTLEGTYKRFKGIDLEGAHDAQKDIEATIEILEEIENRFDVPEDVNDIHDYTFSDDETVDFEGRLKKKKIDGTLNVFFNFGKYRGMSIQEVWKMDPGYYDWIIQKSDMTKHTKNIFINVVNWLKKRS